MCNQKVMKRQGSELQIGWTKWHYHLVRLGLLRKFLAGKGVLLTLYTILG